MVYVKPSRPDGIGRLGFCFVTDERGLSLFARCPADERYESRPDFAPGKLVGGNRIECRRLPAQNVIAP